MIRRSSLSAFLVALLLVGCAQPAVPATPSPTASPSKPPSTPPTTSPSPTAGPSPTTQPSPTPEPVGVLIAAGDIAACDETADSATAALAAGLGGTIATLGDNVYPAGSDATYAQCYDPAWGGLRDRTRPAPGNHDVVDDGGAAYFRYFGTAAGPAGQGWYAYDLATWHVVVLNSNCELVDCGEGSAQLAWLVADLAASDARCTVAYWHHPRFSSGPHGDIADVTPLWDALADADADLVLVGHDHHYERFGPQTSGGSPDPNGIREFVAGTGGKELRPTVRVAPNSERIVDDAFGVLRLTLSPDAYAWSFLTVSGDEADAGSARCH